MVIDVTEINPCDPVTWKQKFFSNKFYCDIATAYKFVIFSHKEMTLMKAALNDTVYVPPRNFLNDHEILDAIPYYYINFLLENNPKFLIDLGCGVNYFKPHVPGLVGIDADPESAADIFDHFDQDFVAGHQHYCDALISINTIHFAPVTELTQRLKWISELVKPGGRGFVSFNIETWLMYTTEKQNQTLFGDCPSFEAIVNYVNHQILATGLKFLVVDWPVLHISDHSTIRDDLNGNIRLVFEV
jgi:hypothetical protein